MNIIRPSDFHVHLRDTPILEDQLPYFDTYLKNILVMPNVPEILTPNDAKNYFRKIAKNEINSIYLMTIKLTHSTTKEEVKQAKEIGVIGYKLYPDGVTTGSHNGVKAIRPLFPIFEEMQKQGLVLEIHAEAPGHTHLTREVRYLDEVKMIVKNFPGLRIVIEHVSSMETVEFIKDCSVNVAGTITAHHLLLTNDDLYGQNHNYCLPIPKFELDRKALIDAAKFSTRFFFGSDSAIHLKEKKECAVSCAGVFSPPIISITILAEIFGLCDPSTSETGKDRKNRFENFVSHQGTDFYHLPRTTETISLVREKWEVPTELCGAVPFKAGKVLEWQLSI